MKINFDYLNEQIKKTLNNDNQVIVGEEGTIISVEDGIVRATGLSGVMLNEIVKCENGEQGIALNLAEDHVGIVMFDDYSKIRENQKVYRTNKVFQTAVGDNFLGRVINPLARPIDGKGEIQADAYLPIEKIAPGVMLRKSVDQPLVTGILSIDAMFPIGRGQRELIIGDRQTGKTTIAMDTIINQKNSGIYCVYVAVGQKNSTIAALVANLEAQGALEYTTVVSSTASDLPALQYIAPYVGVTLAEYWMSKGKDVLIIYDDLSKHAVAYRTLSLLLRRPPGREAYPGDVFYLHSRLLERACRLDPKYGGGSITALPIIETQAGDISAYIPTNVISITDGQIFMMTSLFNAGQRPAIDAGLSVSRVGGAAQIKSVKQMGASMKLELANYRELDAFSQFGSELDSVSKQTLNHGKRIMELLKQAPNEPYNQTQEAIILFCIKEGFIDLIPVELLTEYRNYFLNKFNKTPLFAELTTTKAFDKNKNMLAFRHAFKQLTLEFIETHNITSEDVDVIKGIEALSQNDEKELNAYNAINDEYKDTDFSALMNAEKTLIHSDLNALSSSHNKIRNLNRIKSLQNVINNCALNFDAIESSTNLQHAAVLNLGLSELEQVLNNKKVYFLPSGFDLTDVNKLLIYINDDIQSVIGEVEFSVIETSVEKHEAFDNYQTEAIVTRRAFDKLLENNEAVNVISFDNFKHYNDYQLLIQYGIVSVDELPIAKLKV